MYESRDGQVLTEQMMNRHFTRCYEVSRTVQALHTTLSCVPPLPAGLYILRSIYDQGMNTMLLPKVRARTLHFQKRSVFLNLYATSHFPTEPA